MGENITVLINVRSCEDKVISDGRIVMTIERSGYESFLSLSNSTIQLSTFLRKYARTRQIHVPLTAAGSLAKEAAYLVKGMVLVGEPIRSKIISSHYSPVDGKKSFDSVTDGMSPLLCCTTAPRDAYRCQLVKLAHLHS